MLTKRRVTRAKAATVVVLTKCRVTRAKAVTVVVLTGNQPQQHLHVKCDPNTLHILYTSCCVYQQSDPTAFTREV